MTQDARSTGWERWAMAAVAVVVGLAMGIGLWQHGGPMARAAERLDARAVALALALAVVYRLVNAAGWGLVLGGLGEPVGLARAARVWLASEACRWLPGSLWAFGSRALLARRRGVSGPTASVSVVVELGLTVLAWGLVALAGWGQLELPHAFCRDWAWPSSTSLAAVVLGAGLAVALATRLGLVARVRGRLAPLAALGASRPDAARLVGALAFYTLMGAFNGLVLLILARATPGGAACPAGGVVSANAVAWLVGFFALFAPGGLVVREACLAGLLAAWMPAEQAVVVALAWRLVQILSEMAVFAAVALSGLPEALRSGPTLSRA